MSDKKKIVFIHGSDPGQANTPFMFYHLHPSTYTSPVKSEGKTFELVYFDFAAGKRKTWKSWTAMRATGPPAAAPDDESPLLPKVQIRDQDGTPVPGDPRPSVLAFYRWLKIQPPKSIVSIQIFSHGTTFQPVLFALSFEWGDDPAKRDDLTAERDPKDTEFRLRDFEGTNPLAGGDPWNPAQGGEIEKFRAALDPDCFIKIWGCGEQTQRGHGEGIRRMVMNYLKVKSGKAGDAQRSAHLLDYLAQVREYFPFRLAERLQMPVWAGPVGWGSDEHDVDGKFDKATYQSKKYHYVGKFPPKLDKKELWWRVSVLFLHNRPIVERFFKRALGAKLDVMGYVEYTSAWVSAAEVAATTAAAPASSPIANPQALMQRLVDRIQQFQSGNSSE